MMRLDINGMRQNILITGFSDKTNSTLFLHTNCRCRRVAEYQLLAPTTWVSGRIRAYVQRLAMPSRSIHFGDISETNGQKTGWDQLTRNVTAVRNNEGERARRGRYYSRSIYYTFPA